MDFLTKSGQAGLLDASLQQLLPEFLFQGLDVGGNGRLTDAQLGGGTSQAARAHHFHEDLERIEIKVHKQGLMDTEETLYLIMPGGRLILER